MLSPLTISSSKAFQPSSRILRLISWAFPFSMSLLKAMYRMAMAISMQTTDTGTSLAEKSRNDIPALVAM